MKKELSISIEKPCSENWSTFSPTLSGGFCSSCSKNVIDFTKMSEDEILHFFKNNQGNTCGRFHSQQLKTYNIPYNTTKSLNLSWFKVALVSLPLVLAGKYSSAQTNPMHSETEVFEGHRKEKDSLSKPNDTIKGVVMDKESKETYPGVTVYIHKTTIGTITDIDGKFELSNLKEGDILVFSAIGLETYAYTVPKVVPYTIKIELEYSKAIMMGEVVTKEVYVSKTSSWSAFWNKMKTSF